MKLFCFDLSSYFLSGSTEGTEFLGAVWGDVILSSVETWTLITGRETFQLNPFVAKENHNYRGTDNHASRLQDTTQGWELMFYLYLSSQFSINKLV